MFSVPTKRTFDVLKTLRFNLKSVFEKLRFRKGLGWTVGLTIEMEHRFQIPPAYCVQCQMHGLLVNFGRI